MKKSLAELELQRINWSELRDASGYATNTPDAIRSLLSADSPNSAKNAYWMLENYAVLQGQVFQSAEFIVPVLISSLLDVNPRHVKICVLELLFQIISGVPHDEEISAGNGDVVERCRMKARDGLAILYHEMVNGEFEAARENIEVLENNIPKIHFYINNSGVH